MKTVPEQQKKIVFSNESSSNYESIKYSVIQLLKGKNIKYEYESSASMASEKFVWNNGAFEIDFSTRKNNDHFVEVDFCHGN